MAAGELQHPKPRRLLGKAKPTIDLKLAGALLPEELAPAPRRLLGGTKESWLQLRVSGDCPFIFTLLHIILDLFHRMYELAQLCRLLRSTIAIFAASTSARLSRASASHQKMHEANT